jgi:hypothetical protein
VATHGSAETPIMEQAARRLSPSPEPIQRLEEALDFVDLPNRWPPLRLYPAGWAAASQDEAPDA